MKKNFLSLREKMVKEQLIPRGINNTKVLQVLGNVPRHKFVPEKYSDVAYGDFPLPIGAGQTISQPYMVALMTQCLELLGTETVLEIGTGSGYQTAILAEIVSQVYSVERISSLATVTQARLRDLDYQNIQIKIGDGTLGWPKFAPYDRIIISAAAPVIPKPLIKQLKIGGKLIIPLGRNFNQILTVVNKDRNNKIELHQICGCVFVPLKGQYGWKEKNG
jgi:protein-L-isoaspartate(D-aspartate) O-methyltransferase